jgi:hypothetical protein
MTMIFEWEGHEKTPLHIHKALVPHSEPQPAHIVSHGEEESVPACVPSVWRADGLCFKINENIWK